MSKTQTDVDVKPEPVQLVGTRGPVETGMPTTGIGVLVGHPKSGKTRLAASFPHSYVLELEHEGANRMSGRIHDIKDLETFRAVLPILMKDPTIKNIVVDTVDELDVWIRSSIAKKLGLTHFDEVKKGVDGFEKWGEHAQIMGDIISYFQHCGKFVLLLAHCRFPKMDEKGAVVIPAGINVPGKSGPMIAAAAKLIGYTFKEDMGSENRYYINFRGGPLGTWGSRVNELNDKIITLPADNPYSAIEALFNGIKINGGKK